MAPRLILPVVMLLWVLGEARGAPLIVPPDPDGLEEYRFTAIYSLSDPFARPATKQVAEFTPLGPVAGTIRPPRVTFDYITMDPRDGAYYGARKFRDVFRWDPATGATVSLSPPTGQGQITGVTFDSARNRLVISRSDTGALLSAYDLEQGTWSDLPVQPAGGIPYSLTYSAAEDAFYALRQDGIARYDAEGRSAGLLEGRFEQPVTDDQLIAVKDRLVLLTAPYMTDQVPYADGLQRSVLMDPARWTVMFLGPVTLVPEPGVMCLVAMGAGLLCRRRARGSTAPWRGLALSP
jgi:hypothetical protein